MGVEDSWDQWIHTVGFILADSNECVVTQVQAVMVWLPLLSPPGWGWSGSQNFRPTRGGG